MTVRVEVVEGNGGQTRKKHNNKSANRRRPSLDISPLIWYVPPLSLLVSILTLLPFVSISGELHDKFSNGRPNRVANLFAQSTMTTHATEHGKQARLTQ
jgi:nitrate reductase beta subunit